MGTSDQNHVIDLEESIDPTTGTPVFTMNPNVEPNPTAREISIRGGNLTAGTDINTASNDESIQLTLDRFAAGYGDEFHTIESAQDAGSDLRIVNGKILSGPQSGADPTQSIELTDKRFAAMSEVEIAEINKLARSGAAERYINTLRPTSDMPSHFPDESHGMYLHTKPTKYGDELHVVIDRDASTSLYHAHLWTFLMMDNSRLHTLDLNRWIGTPGLSAHDAHLYPGRNDLGAVLCLSTDNRGGMPSLSQCVVRCAQWAAGMGEVVRGRPFPFRQ